MESDTSKQGASLYDRLFREGYRKVPGAVDRARINALRHFILRVARPGRVSRVLDYGCGSGVNADLWEEIFPGAEVFACDISAVAIDEFRRLHPKSGPNVRVVEAGSVPFPDSFFDVVISVEVMEHVEDLEGYLGDIRRVLVAGGLFVWTTPSANALSVEHFYAGLTGNIQPTGEGFRRWRFEDPTHLRRLKTREAKRILGGAGFAEIRFRHRAHLFSFLCARCLPGRLGFLAPVLLPLDYLLFRCLPNGASMIGQARRTETPAIGAKDRTAVA